MTNKRTVIVNATKRQLFDIGVCSDSTFEWLLDGKPKKVVSERKTPGGRNMLYFLRGSWSGWVYEDMTTNAN